MPMGFSVPDSLRLSKRLSRVRLDQVVALYQLIRAPLITRDNIGL